MLASTEPIYLSELNGAHGKRIRNYVWVLAVGWTLVIASSFWWSYCQHDHEIVEFGRAEARAAIERDIMYRRWASLQSGLYVEISEKHPPNPGLSHVPGRDITTTTGRKLTMLNPAYMTRQVYEMARESKFVGRGHLTSLKPIRPENGPDPWERESLLTLEKGAKEVSEIQESGGGRFMRLMRPLVTDESCLKCHAYYGYKIGEIRGGLSISIPLAGLEAAAHRGLQGSAAGHGLMLLLGLGVIGLGADQLSRSARAQKRIENELHLSNQQLEQEIAERQGAQEAQQESEARLRIVADFASDWEYWRLPDGSFEYVSPSAAEFTGYEAEEFINDRELLYRVIHPDDRENFRHHTHQVDEKGRILPIEIRIVKKNGKVSWVGHTCRQVHTRDGRSWGWRASNQDITDRKQIEFELFEQTEQLKEEVTEREASQDELERLNHSLEERVSTTVNELRRKDQMLIQQSRLAAMGEMINNIAHQWRQPLNNIGLIIQNLQLSYDSGTISGEEMETETRKAMAVIMHMSRTIDDFRNFFREDKERQGFHINSAVKRALEFVSASMESRGIRVTIETEQDVAVTGYPSEYSQVLLNVIANACEACSERCVTDPRIDIIITSENSRSVVYVRDNCGGIPDEIMPKIFDPYFTTREPDKGSGIGLYMSKVIIELNMGGSLTARNLDGGAEFRIEV